MKIFAETIHSSYINSIISVTKKLKALLQGRMGEAKDGAQTTYRNAGNESSVGKFMRSMDNSHFPLPKIISYCA